MSRDLIVTLYNALGSMPAASNLAKAQKAVYLIAGSPEFLIER